MRIILERLALFRPVVESDPRGTNWLLIISVLAGLSGSGVLVRCSLWLCCLTINIHGNRVCCELCCAAHLGTGLHTRGGIGQPLRVGVGLCAWVLGALRSVSSRLPDRSTVLNYAGIHAPDREPVVAVNHYPAHSTSQADPDDGRLE